jgi:sugar lactone lactonase YvrE
MRRLFACVVALVLAAPCSAEVEVIVGSPAGRVAKEPDPALVNEPFAVAFDAAGRMYGVEYTRGNRLFRVGVDRTIEFLAGGFHGLHDVAVGPNGLVYLADTFNHRIRGFDPKTGTVSVVAGTGAAGFGGDGGPAATAVFNQAYCGSLTPDGRSLLVADLANARLRRIDLTSGIVTTVAGNGTKGKPLDGTTPLEAPLAGPRAACQAADGTIYLALREGNAVVEIKAGRIRTVVNASGRSGYAGDGGPAREALLAGPKYVSLDRRGRLLIADTENHCIRRYDPASGTITTVAGIPTQAGSAVGADLLATQLARPHGCCLDPAGRLVIADSDNDRILAGPCDESGSIHAAGPIDIVVYGGNACGIVAGIQAKRMGRSVVVIEPSRRIGGLTTGGLGQTDIGNKRAIGGLARDFYRAVRRHYESPEAWKWQPRSAYRSDGQSKTADGEDAMWTFEPSAALAILESWVAEHAIEVVRGERLDREAGVKLARGDSPRIESIRMESGRVFTGRIFIDATYEGDLMAAAGVKYAVGREANADHGESLNGVQHSQAKYHQMKPGVSAYRVPGDPASGLLPFVEADDGAASGSGDRRVQAYNFRMCLTDHPDNRIPFTKPAGYDPEWYELLLRNFEAGEREIPWINSPMPNRKTDTNNRLGVSTDFIGRNYDYPDASYARREEIVARHRLYQQGLMWTLANHPRVPESIRREVSRWGMCRDEFVAGDGWQEQLYVREARRMLGAYLVTEADCWARRQADDSVGLAAYGIDSHHVRRIAAADGTVRNEGDVQVHGFKPFRISYRAITPRAAECGNLLVPVCLSATHVAYGSIRMEPVFMVLGQSAATAAAQAIDQRCSVQAVDVQRLRDRLAEDGQLLDWVEKAAGAP